MEETRIIERSKKVVKKIFHDQFVFSTFLGLTFFVLAYAFFTPLFGWSDLYKLFLIIYGCVVITLSLVLIYEYLIKTIKLQLNPNIKIYSVILSVNTFFGLIMPLFYINIVLFGIVKAMSWMQNFGTVFCTIRNSFVHFYYNNNIGYNINQIIMSLIILNAILFLFGGLVERLRVHLK